MHDLSQFLSNIDVRIDQLLLDPNNPRFAELGDVVDVIEARFAEPKVQSVAQQKMLNPQFEVNELRDTMLEVGYLPMDRLVVKRLSMTTPDGSPYFVVIEGNRRLAALRLIKALYEEGKVNLDDNWLAKLDAIGVLELSSAAPDSARLVLPGLRHVSGVKEWGPYQKAKAVHRLRESGLTPSEAAQSLGLSTRAANMAYRCYLALEQMNTNEEFGDQVTPRLYSYFEEMFKRPNVRAWLNWSDEDKRFLNNDNVMEFYSWIVPQSEDGESQPARLPEAKSLRDLGLIIDDEDAMAAFRAPNGSLVRALARHEVEHRVSWQPQIVAACEALKRLSPDDIRSLTVEEWASIEALQSAVEQLFADRTALLPATTG